MTWHETVFTSFPVGQTGGFFLVFWFVNMCKNCVLHWQSPWEEDVMPPMPFQLWWKKTDSSSHFFPWHWFLFILLPSYCIFSSTVPHSSSSLFEVSCFFLFLLVRLPASPSHHHLLSLTLASIFYPTRPHMFLTLPLSFSLTSASIHIWIPVSSLTLGALSSLTCLSFSLYLSNLLLFSHVPVILPEAELSELCQS